MALRPDAWLAGVLGVPAYAADPGDALPPGPAFVYSKVDTADTSAVGALERAGFSVVDVNVTFMRRGGVGVGEDRRIGPASAEHREQLLDVAGSCFSYSRFHLDRQLPAGVADAVKREWVRSYLDGKRGVELLAAVDGGRALGFLAVLDAGDARVIDLLGVAPEAQGRGLGTALVQAFIGRHGSSGRELRVGTQIANVPSLRLYARQGFEIESAAYVLHVHVPA